MRKQETSQNSHTAEVWKYIRPSQTTVQVSYEKRLTESADIFGYFCKKKDWGRVWQIKNVNKQIKKSADLFGVILISIV